MDYIKNLLVDFGVQDNMVNYLSNAILIVGIVVISILANFITKKIVIGVLTYYIKKRRLKWGSHLLERKVFRKLSHVVPGLIIYYFSYSFPTYQPAIENSVAIYMVVVMIAAIDAFLHAVNDIYMTYEISKSRPIRSYIQVVKIFIFIIGGVLIISKLVGQSPLILLSGIGALSAVTMLVFKDSILGLVAGIQLTSNDMVRVGDWIEMPKYQADGDIIDISLNTVKVQNWDKTITTVPTYALISDSFKNWRGMQSSGGRRIKRSIYIDMSSITFCSPDMIEEFEKIQLIKTYITSRKQEIEQYNIDNEIDRSSKVNGRALTNIGVFREYIQRYLEHHPGIHHGMTCMVRQLQPDETGLPIEIYAFVNDIRWTVYEGVQSDIFDHVLAVATEFGLRVFQNPSGHDWRSLEQSDRV